MAPLVELARTLRRHWDWAGKGFDSRISNGVLEAINGLVQAANRGGRGYRNVHCLITLRPAPRQNRFAVTLSLNRGDPYQIAKRRFSPREKALIDVFFGPWLSMGRVIKSALRTGGPTVAEKVSGGFDDISVAMCRPITAGMAGVAKPALTAPAAAV